MGLSFFSLLLYLRRKNRNRIRLLADNLFKLQAYYNKQNWKKLKKYQTKLKRLHKYTPKQTKHPRWQPKRNRGPLQGPIHTIDIHDRTGIYEDTFEWIYYKIKDKIIQPRYHPFNAFKTRHITKTGLDTRTRLLLVLHWLRHYPHLSILRDIYGVSKSYISRDIRHIIPILYTTLSNIKLPEKWETSGRFDTVGAVDCTSHYRWRVHPGQSLYYRGDKHAHMLTAQVSLWCYGLLHLVGGERLLCVMVMYG